MYAARQWILLRCSNTYTPVTQSILYSLMGHKLLIAMFLGPSFLHPSYTFVPFNITHCCFILQCNLMELPTYHHGRALSSLASHCLFHVFICIVMSLLLYSFQAVWGGLSPSEYTWSRRKSYLIDCDTNWRASLYSWGVATSGYMVNPTKFWPQLMRLAGLHLLLMIVEPTSYWCRDVQGVFIYQSFSMN